MTVGTILIVFLLAVVVGLVGYVVSKFVPFLHPYQNAVGLGLFVLVLILGLLVPYLNTSL